MKAKYIPNIITGIRVILVPFFLFFLIKKNYLMALIIFLVAGLSDGLDGLLARWFGWTTRLGAILDPLADKFLIVMSFLTLTWLDLLPIWLCCLVMIRDFLILSGVGYVLYTARISRSRLGTRAVRPKEWSLEYMTEGESREVTTPELERRAAYRGQPIELKPSVLSKWNTLFQITLVAALLAHMTLITVPDQLLIALMAIVAITTFLSLLGYLKRGLGYF